MFLHVYVLDEDIISLQTKNYEQIGKIANSRHHNIFSAVQFKNQILSQERSARWVLSELVRNLKWKQ